MNVSGNESEGEDPHNLCEIDEIHELCENQGTDHADKDADYVPSRGETSGSSEDDSSHNMRQDNEQPKQPADTSSTRAASLPLAPNVPITRGGRGRGRGRNCSQITNNPVLGSVETTAHGTQWTVIPPQAAPGRRARQNIVTEAPDLQAMRRESHTISKITNRSFAAATPIWNTFIANCLLCYKPSENITVDEQLFPCKARCPFIQYMNSKPDKFGIKFWLAVDTTSKYLVNGFPYIVVEMRSVLQVYR
ncbi:hypothetical protein ANN_27731 [Periplaneta americana]|uniref:PiggyBac transposable element-derived protein domain-containing protein n=1 Tax=Periplaneta americana TaxID=6978 RepID=A0ABQ8RV40_PERAM|nr:hypothetical protein ANN_27731 [Periplaneta americana]